MVKKSVQKLFWAVSGGSDVYHIGLIKIQYILVVSQYRKPRYRISCFDGQLLVLYVYIVRIIPELYHCQKCLLRRANGPFFSLNVHEQTAWWKTFTAWRDPKSLPVSTASNNIMVYNLFSKQLAHVSPNW